MKASTNITWKKPKPGLRNPPLKLTGTREAITSDQNFGGAGAVNCERSAKPSAPSISPICFTASSYPSLPNCCCSISSNLSPICCQRQSRTGECRDSQELATGICSVHRFDSPSRALVQSAFFQTVPGRRRSFIGRDIVRCHFCARAGTSALPIAFGVGGSDGYF